MYKRQVFGGFTGVEVSGKTGTAQQVETRPNHARFVVYAPSSNPEITIATRISYGYSSHNALSLIHILKSLVSYPGYDNNKPEACCVEEYVT